MMRHALLSAKVLISSLIGAGILLAGAIFAAESPAKPERVDLLFVQNSSTVAVDVEKHTLTLAGLSPTTIFFSDRPVRIAGHYTTEEFLKLWSEGKDSFLASPPNATLSVFQKGKAELADLVVKLTNPKLKGNDLTYDITVMEGQAPKVGGPASLFIDFFVMPWRFERRAVMYGAAMTSVAAAQSMEMGPTPQYRYGEPQPGAGGPPPSAPVAPATPTEKLLELKSLYAQGLISQSEYEAKKQEVLNQLVQ